MGLLEVSVSASYGEQALARRKVYRDRGGGGLLRNGPTRASAVRRSQRVEQATFVVGRLQVDL
jgi:hypothetical protein